MTDLKHMDVASRNQRLRETLEGMGLFVLPIYCESDPQRIDYMQVSAELPSRVKDGAQHSASGPVPAPVTRSEVAEVVGAADTSGGSVVNFPSKLRQ